MTKTNPLLLITLSLTLLGCPSTPPEDGPDATQGVDAAQRGDAGGRDAGGVDTSDASAGQDAAQDRPDATDSGEGDSGEPSSPDTLRLATWNVSYLDVLGGSDEAPRTQADYDLLETYVARLDADVVALQEVRGVAGTQTIFPADAWSAECEDRNSAQNVCVLVRDGSGWQLTRNPDLVALNVGNANLRQGLDVTISKPGLATLRVLAVHLKSGCFFGEDGSGCPTFFEQIDVIEQWVDARAAAGEAYAVLGDFNRVMTADDVAWLELDDSDPANADLTRSIPQGTPTPCWSDLFTEFIDHIILDPTSASWLAGSGQNPYDETDFDAYYLRLSDHCPLWADFVIPAAN
jgi:endonuclease/exonuclease/phosphatase family metal-dependent hydrolase